MRAPIAWVVFLAPLASGCASIVSKSDWPVSFTSNPPGVPFTVRDEQGVVVAQGVTPWTVTLRAKEGFFQGADYVVEAQGERFELASSLNGWYWGNILFGGLIGLFVVDPATGAMWRLPEKLSLQGTAGEPGTGAP